ncbi:hypothetical protein VNO77_14077 [Canavalia gladiata]|uniref:Uncharacterized protein n=1 Tax=Canavalia gladiata TaxID=3824 RepID=A0AAN9QRV4_CANGL
MERKEPMDFSSYIYFEASGDSEADCDPIYATDEIARVDDNDDALSCSYDGSDACNHTELDGYEVWDEDEDEDENEDEKKEDGVYGMSYCEDDEMEEEHLKSYVSFESGQEFVDEMEKNRLFWEACLAS